MEINHSQLRADAREALKGKWGLAIGGYFIYYLIIMLMQSVPFMGFVASILLSGPLMLGVSLFSITLARKEEAKIEQLFQGFNDFGRALASYLLMCIFIFLWLLLLIVPGIIKALAYSQTFYILLEDREIQPMDALKKSEKMMNGYKMDMFLLGLYFFLLAILCLLTLGIGFLWLFPYMHLTFTNFYEKVKENIA